MNPTTPPESNFLKIFYPFLEETSKESIEKIQDAAQAMIELHSSSTFAVSCPSKITSFRQATPAEELHNRLRIVWEKMTSSSPRNQDSDQDSPEAPSSSYSPIRIFQNPLQCQCHEPDLTPSSVIRIARNVFKQLFPKETRVVYKGNTYQIAGYIKNHRNHLMLQDIESEESEEVETFSARISELEPPIVLNELYLVYHPEMDSYLLFTPEALEGTLVKGYLGGIDVCAKYSIDLSKKNAIHRLIPYKKIPLHFLDSSAKSKVCILFRSTPKVVQVFDLHCLENELNR